MRSRYDGFETGLLELANDHLDFYGKFIENYQKVEIYINDHQVIKAILKEFKFKNIGNLYDYPGTLQVPASISDYDLTGEYKLFQKIALSEKYSMIMYYNADMYSIHCIFIIDTKSMKIFAKRMKVILKKDSGMNLFRAKDFKDVNSNEFIEIVDSMDDKTKKVEVLKRKVSEEKLVFDEKSSLSEVMQDISTFFKKKSVKLYTKLSLPYKRGIIVYGDPGNGKSAMIREIIRRVSDIPKVVVNCDPSIFVKVIQSLTRVMDGKPVIIIIEDIDSMITEYNRSAFLNILDGVDMISGFYFIGTTNFPERIDPAIMNRSGRFDRTYKIDNPDDHTRKIYFESRKIYELLLEYIDPKKYKEKDIVDLFVLHSEGLPMSNLKELITATCYLLVSNEDISVENAIKDCGEKLKTAKTDHVNSYTEYRDVRRGRKKLTASSFDED